jgi:hypothetical protein
VGPLLFSSSNLGPLLGIFVTGPIGALAGAFWGLARAATDPHSPVESAAFRWGAGIWGVTLLYTLFLLGLGSQAVVPAIGLQVFMLSLTGFLMYHSGGRVRRFGPVVLAALALIVLTTAFPPVTRPWWGTGSAREWPDSVALPKRALVLDPRFDASRQVPLLAVNRGRLMLEWVIIGGVILGLGLLLLQRPSRAS